MQDPLMTLTLAAMALIALAMISSFGLRGWRDWIALKRMEIEQHRESHPSSAASRIEVADLKERIRKLEAIASGVEL